MAPFRGKSQRRLSSMIMLLFVMVISSLLVVFCCIFGLQITFVNDQMRLQQDPCATETSTGENSVNTLYSHGLPVTRKSHGNEDAIIESQPNQVARVNLSAKAVHDGLLTAGLLRQDNLMIGKSFCYNQNAMHWDCRDCGMDENNNATNDRHNCSILQQTQPEYCAEWPMTVGWDTPRPQSHSFMDPTASHHAARNILSFYDIDNRYEQVPCSLYDDYCFDFSKCSPMTDGQPMKVYAHGNVTSRAFEYVSTASKLHPTIIQQVSNPLDACFLVVTCDSYPSFSHLQSSPAWNDGMNHLVWYSSHCFGGHYSRTFDKINYAKASLASSTYTYASIRMGYDVPLTQVRGDPKREFAVSMTKLEQIKATMGMPRRWLLGYKGRIAAQYPHPWFHHRWLAFKYWNESDSYLSLDTKCWGKSLYKGKKEYSNKYEYGEMLWNATFAFCPGGANAGSYRFSEALGLGSIPVVTADFVPPFEPEIDWSDCAVRVSEARIVDLPRLLREIPVDEVVRRQRRCFQLFEATLGWVVDREDEGQWRIDAGQHAFVVTMRIWAWRIRNALNLRNSRRELERAFES